MKFKKVAISTNLSSLHKNIYRNKYFKRLLQLLGIKKPNKIFNQALDISKIELIAFIFFGKLQNLTQNKKELKSNSILSNLFRQNIQNLKSFDSNNAYIKIYEDINPIGMQTNPKLRQPIFRLYYYNLWH